MAKIKLNNIYKISEANYNTLINNQVYNGHTYDPSALYLVEGNGLDLNELDARYINVGTDGKVDEHLYFDSSSLSQFSGSPSYLVGIEAFADPGKGELKWQSTSSITVGIANNLTNFHNGYNESGNNPDTIGANGFWEIQKSNSGTHPSGIGTEYRIINTGESTSGWHQQIATDYYSDNIWYRRQNSSTWQSWNKLAFALNYEWNKQFSAGRSDKLYIGRFKLYDSNITIEISSTTSNAYSGKIVVASQNGAIQKFNIYGDPSGSLSSRIFMVEEGVSGSRQWIKLYLNPEGWSKNLIHIKACGIEDYDSSVLCTAISSIPTATKTPTTIGKFSFDSATGILSITTS